MNHYLYAIVDRLPAAWRPPASGLGAASVVPRRVHDLVVLGSLLDVVPPPNPRTLALHHDIVRTVMDADALLPLPYGTTVPAGAVVDWLTARRVTLAAVLESVRGCVEMRVKLLRLGDARETRAPARAGGRGGTAGEAPAVPALQALADALVERAALPRWRVEPGGGAGNVALSIAFLVPRAELSGFLARIAPVASHADGVAVVPTGPWPPAAFVPDLARAAGRDVTDRRAG